MRDVCRTAEVQEGGEGVRDAGCKQVREASHSLWHS